VVKEVDRKRVADNEEIAKQIEAIGKAAANAGRAPVRRSEPAAPPSRSNASGSEAGFEHIIASGDTLSTIAEAFRANGVKVSVDDILKANPGLKATSLRVGQKIFIPAPK